MIKLPPWTQGHNSRLCCTLWCPVLSHGRAKVISVLNRQSWITFWSEVGFPAFSQNVRQEPLTQTSSFSSSPINAFILNTFKVLIKGTTDGTKWLAFKPQKSDMFSALPVKPGYEFTDAAFRVDIGVFCSQGERSADHPFCWTVGVGWDRRSLRLGL